MTFRVRFYGGTALEVWGFDSLSEAVKEASGLADKCEPGVDHVVKAVDLQAGGGWVEIYQPAERWAKA